MKLTLILLFTFISQILFSQNICETVGYSPEWEKNFQVKIREYLNNHREDKELNSGNKFKIPIIIHVLHDGDEVGIGENLSYDQLKSQIPVLNAAFSSTNEDIARVPDIFKSDIAGDMGIEFYLAQFDNNGSKLNEPGVERINWREAKGIPNPARSSNDFAFKLDLKQIMTNSIWDPNQYLNVWVSDSKTGLFGLAIFPIGTGMVLPFQEETNKVSGFGLNMMHGVLRET